MGTRLSPESRGFSARAPLAMKVAIVTGSGKGIGRGIAVALAQSGFRVALNYQSDATSARETARQAGGETIRVQADVRRPAGAKKLVAATLKAWGRVDVLVNNVGDFFPTPVRAMEIAKWDELYDSNVRTALNCTREVLPAMRKRKHGVIVNIGGTVTGTLRGNRNYVGYVMAKTALAVFTKSLAQAEAANGIRANIICPGYIRTYFYSKQDVAELTPQVPAKRLGDPAEVGQLVAYLSGPEAAYINGASIDIGGALWV